MANDPEKRTFLFYLPLITLNRSLKTIDSVMWKKLWRLFKTERKEQFYWSGRSTNLEPTCRDLRRKGEVSEWGQSVDKSSEKKLEERVWG